MSVLYCVKSMEMDMVLPKIRHTSKVCSIKDPPITILLVEATIPLYPASEFARERQDLQNDVALAVGDRLDYYNSEIHWADGNVT
jgi:hypothetical protein